MGGSTWAVTFASVLAGLGGAGAVWHHGRTGTTGRTVMRGLSVAAIIGAVGFGFMTAAGMGLFGMVHLLYLGLVLAVPMIGVATLASAWRLPRRRGPVALGAALLVPALVGFYATHIEPHRLRVDHVAVSVDPDRRGHDVVRIAVLADFQTNHIGAFERRVIDRLAAQHADVVLVPGDLFQADNDEFDAALPEIQRLMGRIRAPGGVFVVQGDVDGDRMARSFATNPDARVLDDEVVTVHVRDRVLRIGGTMLTYDSPAANRVKRALERDPEDGSFRILLSHRPDTVFGLGTDSRVDLTVAGHTHGGQVVLPLIGPLMTMSAVPRDVARGGLHEMDGNRIYVSPGIGMERYEAPQVRFNDPPTLGVLELRDPPTAGEHEEARTDH